MEFDSLLIEKPRAVASSHDRRPPNLWIGDAVSVGESKGS